MHKTPEDAAKDVLTGDLGPLQLSFSQFRTRMITEYPYVLSDEVLHDLYIRFSEPDAGVVMPRLMELLKGPRLMELLKGEHFFTVPLDETTTKPEDLFGPINIESLAKAQGVEPYDPERTPTFPIPPEEMERIQEELAGPSEVVPELLAMIERIEGKVDNTQRVQEVILRNQMAQYQAQKKQKRQRIVNTVRNKFRRR